MDTSHNYGFIAYPHVIAYHDVAFVVPSGSHICLIQFPIFIK